MFVCLWVIILGRCGLVVTMKIVCGQGKKIRCKGKNGSSKNVYTKLKAPTLYIV